MKGFWKFILRVTGWTVDITVPRRDKCVICVAPHTSNLDFFLGLAAYKSLGRKANFLMKEFWFFFPLNFILKSLGGIPVKKGGHGCLTDKIIGMYETLPYINLAVTPEGTRSAVHQWRTGFLRIAYGAGVPVQLGLLDYANKRIEIKEEFIATADIAHDMQIVKDYYAKFNGAAKFSDKFTV